MLYLCPTPIGNLKDVTLRVLEVLGQADLVACEDTRRTRILLDRHGITARLVSFHDHNEKQRLEKLLPLLREGKDVALVSDAGMPGLSDPGFSLVRACTAENLPVTVLPGPSAISTALVLSGLQGDRFAFVGFLARSRSKLVEQVAGFNGTGAALVAFESPRRIRASLSVVAEHWPDRQIAVCRELTKLHEEVIRGTAAEVLERLAEPVRGEIVLVLEPAGTTPGRRARSVAGSAGRTGSKARTGYDVAATGWATGELEERARLALTDMAHLGIGTKKAAAIVAGLTGLSGRRTYQLALEARKEEDRT